jgi:predicted PurR-regulated permease PerM
VSADDSTSTVRSTALVVIAACCVIALLYLGHNVFVPIVLSLLFALVLSSGVEAFHRRGVPRALSAALMLTSLLVVLGLMLYFLERPTQQWIAHLPQTLQVVERKVRPVQQAITRLEILSNRAGSVASAGSPKSASGAPASAGPALSTSAGEVLVATRESIVSTVTVVILTLFLLSGGPPMVARMMAALAKGVYAAHALEVIEAIRRELGRYYGIITLINIGLGLATGFSMMLLRLPNAFLWGTMAAILNFIPYIGSTITLLVLTFVAVVSFDRVEQILAVVATYLALATIEGQVAQPLFVGRRLEINPTLVFLAVWFGGWMWGVAGIVIAIPSLVALKVVAEHSTSGNALLEFLSPKNEQPVKLGKLSLKRSGGRKVA